MKTLLLSAAVAVSTLFALTTHAALLVYDGIPSAGVPGTGTAYNAAELRNVNNQAQNPTHSSIVGETGGWVATGSGADAGTGTIKVNISTNLVYPAGVNLTSIGGLVEMTSGGNPQDATPYRVMGRAISSPTTTLAGKSFFATALLAYDDLAQFPANAFGGWGLSRGKPTFASYPLSDGVLMGFRKDAASTLTGVSAVLRVAGTFHVIQRDVAPGSHHFFAMRFQYSNLGAEIVSAVLLADGAEPSLAAGGWAVTVTNEVLSATQNFGWVSVGYNYNIANKHLYVDEWRVGTEWRDVAGETQGSSCIFNAGSTSGDRASVSGKLTKIGDPATTVRVYYGRVDGMDDASAWEHVHEFAELATEEGQVFSVEPDNLVSSSVYFFRFAARTSSGETFAPWSDSFAYGATPLTFTTPSVPDLTKNTVTIKTEMLTGYPAATITACLDTVDHGSDSLPSDWAKKTVVGVYEFTGLPSATFSGLTANTDYVARFYGTNVNGDAWSEAVAFTTLTPTLSATDRYVKKGRQGVVTAVSVPVALDVASSRPVSFRYATLQATEANCENAVSGVHYVDESATIVMPPGIMQTNITLHIIGNNAIEFPGKRLYVQFDSVTGAANTPGTAEVGILCDNLGSRIFYDDFARKNTTGWTLTQAAKWSASSGMLTWATAEGGGTALAGKESWAEYGLRVMHRTTGSWQGWAICAYDTSASGGGKYRFWMQNGDYNSQGWGGRLQTNNVFVAGMPGTTVMPGSRIGSGSVLRPISMRINKTPEGYNRVRCWAGFYKAADWIDSSGNFTHGRIGLEAGSWTPLAYDDVEVFQVPNIFLLR